MECTKIAFFVEGQTELILVQKYLNEYFTGGVYRFNSEKIGDRVVSIDLQDSLKRNYHIRITDTWGGNQRKAFSVLRTKVKNLTDDGFSVFAVLNDLYTGSGNEDLQKAINDRDSYINDILKDYAEKIRYIIAVMETEAWYLADPYFPGKKDAKLTPEYIKSKLNIDLHSVNVEEISCPTQVIKDIYKLVNDEYKKKEGQSYQITEEYIDFTHLYSDEVRNKVKSWNYFCNCVEQIFT